MAKWRIRYRLWNPFIKVEISNNNFTRLVGIVPEFYKYLKEKAHFGYDMHLQTDMQFGTKLKNGSWSGMVGALVNNEADIAGPMFMTEERSHVLKFSVPISFAQLSVLSGLEDVKSDSFLLLSIFTWPVWIAIFIILVIVSISASMVYEVLPLENKKNKCEVLFKYIWVFQAGLIGKGFGSVRSWHLRHVGSSLSFRILQGVWCIVGCVTLMNIYQSTITSTFSTDKHKPIITSLDDLLEDKSMKISTFGPSYAATCLLNMKETKYESIWHRAKDNLVSLTPPDEIPDWLDDVESGRRVFVYELGWLQLALSQRYLKTRKCGIVATPIEPCATYVVLAMRKELNNTPFFEDFNMRLRHFSEAELHHRHKTSSALYYNLCNAEDGTSIKPLKVEDVSCALLILTIGIAASAFFLFIEIILSCAFKI